MKDAIGSSVLLSIILAFLAIFIIFIAFIMNYAMAFRASNYVVTMIERSEGNVKIGSTRDNAHDDTLYGALKARLYYNDYLKISCEENNNGAVYTVTTSLGFKLPLFDINIPIYINNETKTLYNVECNSALVNE